MEDKVSKSKTRSSLEEKTRRKKRNRMLRWILFFVFIVFFYAFSKIAYKYIVTDSQKGAQPVEVPQEKLAPYLTLENKDSAKYLAIIQTLKVFTLNDIASNFYNNPSYWPYILVENKNIDNILDIRPETIVRIPRIDSIIGLGEQGVIEAKRLGDSLLTDISEKQKAENLAPGE